MQPVSGARLSPIKANRFHAQGRRRRILRGFSTAVSVHVRHTAAQRVITGRTEENGTRNAPVLLATRSFVSPKTDGRAPAVISATATKTKSTKWALPSFRAYWRTLETVRNMKIRIRAPSEGLAALPGVRLVISVIRTHYVYLRYFESRIRLGTGLNYTICTFRRVQWWIKNIFRLSLGLLTGGTTETAITVPRIWKDHLRYMVTNTYFVENGRSFP